MSTFVHFPYTTSLFMVIAALGGSVHIIKAGQNETNKHTKIS